MAALKSFSACRVIVGTSSQQSHSQPSAVNQMPTHLSQMTLNVCKVGHLRRHCFVIAPFQGPSQGTTSLKWDDHWPIWEERFWLAHAFTWHLFPPGCTCRWWPAGGVPAAQWPRRRVGRKTPPPAHPSTCWAAEQVTWQMKVIRQAHVLARHFTTLAFFRSRISSSSLLDGSSDEPNNPKTEMTTRKEDMLRKANKKKENRLRKRIKRK